MKLEQKGAKDFPSTELYRTICVSETNQKTNTESNLALSVKQTNAKDCLRPSPYLHKT